VIEDFYIVIAKDEINGHSFIYA